MTYIVNNPSKLCITFTSSKSCFIGGESIDFSPKIKYPRVTPAGSSWIENLFGILP